MTDHGDAGRWLVRGALAWGLLAGCNAPTTGASSLLAFTPSRCGYHLRGCDFTGPIATRGVLAVQARPIEGSDRAPSAVSDLSTRDPAIATVAKTEAIDGAPTWELTAHAAGSTELFAVDADRVEIDSIDVRVATPARLGLQAVLGTIDGPTTEVGSDEAWTVLADKPASFDIIARNSGGVRLMGRLGFRTVLPADATMPRELDGSNRAAGYFYIQPAAGEYPVRFELDGDAAVDVDTLIRTRAAP